MNRLTFTHLFQPQWGLERRDILVEVPLQRLEVYGLTDFSRHDSQHARESFQQNRRRVTQSSFRINKEIPSWGIQQPGNLGPAVRGLTRGESQHPYKQYK